MTVRWSLSEYEFTKQHVRFISVQDITVGHVRTKVVKFWQAKKQEYQFFLYKSAPDQYLNLKLSGIK